jgi:hypothetical protein
MSDVDINIIEDFLNYNKEKYLSGIEIESISQLLKAYRDQQIQIERLKKDREILYGVIDELKEDNDGDHIPRID